MRRTISILSLTVLTVFASASDVFAQRRGYGGGWGNSPGISIGFGRGGFYSSNGYYGNQGYSLYNQNYGRGYGNAYQYGPNYSVVPSSYYELQPQIRPSYYIAPAVVDQTVSVTVLVPTVDAQVWFENAATQQQGMERLFSSAPLQPNQTFVYTIKARWMQGGQAVTQERRVNVQAGQSVTVNFRENVPQPRLPNPIPRD